MYTVSKLFGIADTTDFGNVRPAHLPHSSTIARSRSAPNCLPRDSRTLTIIVRRRAPLKLLLVRPVDRAVAAPEVTSNLNVCSGVFLVGHCWIEVPLFAKLRQPIR
jgi:hypothetical protein